IRSVENQGIYAPVDINSTNFKRTIKLQKRGQKRKGLCGYAMSPADGDVSESLSDIDDAEQAGALFKRMIWEAMNKDYDKEKSRKRARMAKKATRAKKPEKAVKVSTVMDTKNRLSSKINYDALDKLNEELWADAKFQFNGIKFYLVRNPGLCTCIQEGTKSNCGNPGDMQLSNEKNNFEGSHDDDFEHESNDTVKRLKPDKAIMMIHMLQMTNIMDATMMTNTIMMRNAILTNYDSNKK
ncbi:hypothetical protein Prudu_011474, partial [Prunus dulcis]